jgi:hypothetical protein
MEEVTRRVETVRAATAPISTISIGVADSAVSDPPIQLLTKALVGVAYSDRSGGNQVARHGLVAPQVDGSLAGNVVTCICLTRLSPGCQPSSSPGRQMRRSPRSWRQKAGPMRT